MGTALNIGDICCDCQKLGLANKLKEYFVNSKETIVKCESRFCLYPYYNDEEADAEVNGEVNAFNKIDICEEGPIKEVDIFAENDLNRSQMPDAPSLNERNKRIPEINLEKSYYKDEIAASSYAVSADLNFFQINSSIDQFDGSQNIAPAPRISELLEEKNTPMNEHVLEKGDICKNPYNLKKMRRTVAKKTSSYKPRSPRQTDSERATTICNSKLAQSCSSSTSVSSYFQKIDALKFCDKKHKLKPLKKPDIKSKKVNQTNDGIQPMVPIPITNPPISSLDEIFKLVHQEKSTFKKET